jgi:hypothetical protein
MLSVLSEVESSLHVRGDALISRMYDRTPIEGSQALPQACVWQEQDTAPVEELEASSAIAFEHLLLTNLHRCFPSLVLPICTGWQRLLLRRCCSQRCQQTAVVS